MGKTVLQRKIAEETLVLEFKQADELSKVLVEASREVSGKLGDLGDSYNLKSVQGVLEDTRKATNARLKGKGKLADTLNKGLDDSVKLTGNLGKIPKSSEFYGFTPVLPVRALSRATAKYTSEIKDVTQELKDRALRQTKLALAQGEGIEELKRRIVGVGLTATKGRDGVFRRARWRAELIGRTTANELSNIGRMEGYLQIDKEFPELEMQKQWSAAGDSRVSDICESLRDQVRKLNENFESALFTGQQPPAHVNCRSAVIPVPAKYDPKFEEAWKTPGKTTKDLMAEQHPEKIQAFLGETLDDDPLSDNLVKKLAKTAKVDKELNKFAAQKVDRLKKMGVSTQEAAAFERYIGSDYREMNSVLWDSGSWSGKEYNRVMAKNRLANSAMKKLPATTLEDIRKLDPENFADFVEKGSYLRHDMTLGPGVLEDVIGKHRKLLDSGDDIVIEKFFSTTFQTKGEKLFAEGSDFRYAVKGKLDGTGRSTLVDQYKNKAFEREVLFRPGTRFKVVSIDDIEEITGYAKVQKVSLADTGIPVDFYKTMSPQEAAKKIEITNITTGPMGEVLDIAKQSKTKKEFAKLLDEATITQDVPVSNPLGISKEAFEKKVKEDPEYAKFNKVLKSAEVPKDTVKEVLELADKKIEDVLFVEDAIDAALQELNVKDVTGYFADLKEKGFGKYIVAQNDLKKGTLEAKGSIEYALKKAKVDIKVDSWEAFDAESQKAFAKAEAKLMNQEPAKGVKVLKKKTTVVTLEEKDV